MRLRVLVVDGEQRRAADMVAVLTAAGYEVSAVVETQSDLYAKVRETGPDVIIIDMDSPDRDMLEHLRGISRDHPRRRRGRGERLRSRRPPPAPRQTHLAGGRGAVPRISNATAGARQGAEHAGRTQTAGARQGHHHEAARRQRGSGLSRAAQAGDESQPAHRRSGGERDRGRRAAGLATIRRADNGVGAAVLISAEQCRSASGQRRPIISREEIGRFFWRQHQRGSLMKKSRFDRGRRGSLLCGGLVGALAAPPMALAADTFADSLIGGKVSLDVRYRYEHVTQDNALKDADASTVRSRLGYSADPYHGVGATLEFENISIVGAEDYNSGANGKPQYAVGTEPKGSEGNQAYLSYAGLPATMAKYGRQRLVLDNQRFIGNVGWRQNEQTFDALSLVNKALPATTLTYAHLSNVNRITATDADMSSDLFNANYAGWAAGALSAYTYLLDTRPPRLHPLQPMGCVSPAPPR